MNTYFIRHSGKLDIDGYTIERLWKTNRVAIHYPQNKKGTLSGHDNNSLDPNDYTKTAKSNLKTLKELANNGGYVYTVYRDHNGAKVGYVEPKTKIKLFEGKWGNKNGYVKRKAILKSLKLTKVKNVDSIDTIPLNAIQPRQITLCRWKAAGERISNLVNNKKAGRKRLKDLTSEQQEVMCMEFLRLASAVHYKLPKIETTITPIGRTMKDVDIYALSTKSEKIICQVSYKDFNKDSEKFKLLLKFKRKNTVVIYFCNVPIPKDEDGIKIFPLSEVFKAFCQETEVGKKWLKNII